MNGSQQMEYLLQSELPREWSILTAPWMSFQPVLQWNIYDKSGSAGRQKTSLQQH